MPTFDELKAQGRDIYRDTVLPGTVEPNYPDKSRIRPFEDAKIDKLAEIAGQVGSSIKGYVALIDLPAPTPEAEGVLAKVEETGLVYRNSGTAWVVFDDPTIQAADRADAAVVESETARDVAVASAAVVAEVIRPGGAPVFGGFADKDGRAPFVILDDELFTLVNPWLTEQLRSAAGPLSGPRVLIFGDSRVDFCSDGLITTTIGWLYWLQLLTGARFDFQPASNFGLGGDDTAEGLARMDAVLSDPAEIAIMLLSVNDRQGAHDFDWTIANLTEILARFRAARKRLIIIAECPWGDAAHPSYILSAQQVAYHLRVREWLISRHDPPWVQVVDPFADMVVPDDASAIAKPGLLKDGGHLAAAGNLIVAQHLAPVIEGLLPPRPRLPASNADQFSTDNPNGALNANPMLEGDGGALATGVTGDLADGWTASNAPTGVSVVLAKETIDGQVWQKVTLSGTPSTSSVIVGLNCALDVGDLAAGDVIEAVAEIHVEDATGIRGVPLRLLATYPTLSSVNASAGHAASTDSIAPAAPWGGIALTPRQTISDEENPSAVSLAVLAYLIEGEATSAVYRFRAVSVRKVFEA